MIQLLAADGTRTPHPELDEVLAGRGGDDDLASPQRLRGYYRDMVMIRAADLEATSLQRQGQLGLWASALGQEAAQIGAGHASREQDYLVPTYREHGIAWARGIEPWRLLESYRGVSHGGWDPNELRTHPYMIVLGSQAPHAVGYAMGLQRDGVVGTGDRETDTAVLALFGDGASSEGEVSESFTFSASFGAPVVFFTQNNQWAISVPTSVQSRVPLAQRSRGWGIPSVRVDGNDVLAVLAAVREALDAARAGEGPRFIEALTYRMAAHTTSDDASRYRPSSRRRSGPRRTRSCACAATSNSSGRSTRRSSPAVTRRPTTSPWPCTTTSTAWRIRTRQTCSPMRTPSPTRSSRPSASSTSSTSPSSRTTPSRRESAHELDIDHQSPDREGDHRRAA